MPIFEYAPDCGECDTCEGRFEVFQKPHLRGLHLKHCPTCSKPCHRVLSAFATPRSDNDLFGDSNVGSQGFVKYKRVSEGEYERVAGDVGPKVITKESLDKADPSSKNKG